MKVRDLLAAIEKAKLEYPDFLDWEVFSEQCTEGDKAFKRKQYRKDIKWHDKENGQGWRVIGSPEADDYGETWEYFECAGFNTFIPKEKAFTINVNY